MDKNLINQKTRHNYDLIATHFSQKRTIDKGWFNWILPYVNSDLKIVDLGCGNGRLYGFLAQNFKKLNYTGIDFSQNLINIAKKNYPQANFVQADITQNRTYKKFKNIDLIFSFRTIHHLPNGFHNNFFKNCYQILRKDGYFMLEVWNMWQKRFLIDHLKQFSLKNLYIPYKAGNITVSRFHYCFTKGELESLARKSGFKVIKSGIKDKGQNIYLVLKKL